MNIKYLTQLYLLLLTINCYSIQYEYQKRQYKKFLNNIDYYFNEYINDEDEIIELTFNDDDTIDIYSNKGVDNETINYVLEVLIDQEIIDKEVNLIEEELKSSGKPEDIAKKISIGKINKFKDENSLMSQDWVMDPKMKVKDVLKNLDISNLQINNFIRLKIGE